MNFWCLLLIFFGLYSAKQASAEDFESSILRVYSHVQKPDYDAPWSGRSSERLTHMGVMVDADHILVAAFAVTGARHFEVEKLGDSRQYPMELTYVDPTINLALLRFSRDKPRGLKVLPRGRDIGLDDTVSLYQGLEGESLVPTPLRLREVEVKPIFLTGYSAPQYVFELKRSGFGWFEPVIREGKLVGAAIAQAGSFVYALPSRVIERFLREAKHKPYRGFAELGFSLSPLTSPDLRRWAQADSLGSQVGAWIHSVDPLSSFGKILKDGDILVELNGVRVSSRGTYQHSRWGRISVSEILSDMGEGQELTVKVLRDGKIKRYTAKAQRSRPVEDKLVPALGDEPPYLIFGGLLLQELSKGLIESWGSQWRKRAPLFYLFEEAFQSLGNRQDRKVVLQRVFPLEYNKGYHDLENDFITQINGVPITHIDSVREALNKPEALQSGYARFSLEPGGDEIILTYKGLDQVHSVLRQRYGIPEKAHFWEPPDQKL